MTRNAILAALPPEDFEAVQAAGEPVSLALRVVLAEFDRPFDHVYFMESGLASTVQGSPDGHLVETLIVGRDGMVGLPLVFGFDRLPMKVFMQCPGEALRVPTARFAPLIEARPALRRALIAYAGSAFTQVAYTALSNASHRIEQRLARWLLMARDRLDSDSMELTHEFLAMMLNVRRSSVTDTLHILEGERLILSTRGRVTIRDRQGLVALAASAYGVPEDIQRRAFGAAAGAKTDDSISTSASDRTGFEHSGTSA